MKIFEKLQGFDFKKWKLKNFLEILPREKFLVIQAFSENPIFDKSDDI